MNDELKDEDEIKEGEEGEPGEELGSVEPDFAASSATTSAFDEENDLEADPHSSFDTATPLEEDPHLDIYGLGVPHGFNGDDEDEDEDELDQEAVDLDAF